MRLDLTPATFLRRYQRFLADVRLADGSVVTAHCPNSGSMRTLTTPEMPCWLARSDKPRRKLPWTLTLLGVPGGRKALVDTMLPNRLVAEAVARGRVAELAGYHSLRREVPYGREGSRVDLLLEAPRRPRCWVEVKNATMLSATVRGRADFPDAVTARGTKHLRELSRLANSGERCMLLYLLGRGDCDAVGVAAAIDPGYARELKRALVAGVEFLCYRARLSVRSATLGTRVPFVPPG